MLDRDGVLNRMWRRTDSGELDSPRRGDHVLLYPTAVDAVRELNYAGVPCAVVSNQPGVAQGKMTIADLDEVTEALLRGLAAGGAHLDAVFLCLHHPQSLVADLRRDCPNRKPRPGLVNMAMRHFQATPEHCWLIGDSDVDVQAGISAGCRTVRVRDGHHRLRSSYHDPRADATEQDVGSAVRSIVRGGRR